MVNNIRRVVVSSLAQAWALLLRFLPAGICTLARSAETGPEQLLGAATRFRLASVVKGAAADVPAIVQQVSAQSQARFESGALFGELERVGAANAILTARITERGVRDAEHFISIYPL
jgi:hypothetical protein